METTRGLVLGGGGLAGIAWEVGVLLGLGDEGVDVASADRIVGTSAGSIVGTLVACGVDLEAVHAEHLAVARGGDGAGAGPAPAVDLEAIMSAWGAAMAESADPVAMRRRIGAFALTVTAPSEQERRAVIAARLPADATTGAWPDRDLRVSAVDTATGEIVIFTRESGVVLAEAVAASCAVPGVWPPITVGERRFMDGGMASIVHVDEVDRPEPVDRLLVVAPLDPPPGGPFAPVGVEVDQRRGRRPGDPVATVAADEASLAAFGANVLDPAVMPGAATAGREQGRRAAAEVAAVWSAS